MGSREQFEAWWRSEMNIEVMDLHRCEFPMQKPDFVQPYACHETQRAWLAWEASRGVPVQLPSGFDLHDWAPESEEVVYLRDVKAALEKVGIKPC